MAEIIVLPQQGNSVESCIIQSWHVKEGDTVVIDQTICEVETDKATLEVPATAAGTVLKRYAAEGDEVPVMNPLLAVGEPGEKLPAEAAASQPAEAAASQSTEAAASQPAEAARAHTAPTNVSSSDGRAGHRASPRARILARTRGISTDGLTGTGPGGRIIVRDVEAALRAGAPGTVPAVTQPAATQSAGSAAAASGLTETTFFDVPVSGVRKVIAERMRASLQTSAQLTLHAPADARRLLAYRERIKAARASGRGASVNITIGDMINFAVAQVLPRFPELNAHFLGSTIRRFSGVDLGFAVDTEKGLLVPTIAGANGLSLTEIHEHARELAERAVSGKARSEDLAPATFTVTNLGALGIEYFTPVLNVPQVAILGVGAITYRPVPQADGTGELIPHITLSLTVDHQAVDGAPAAKFLQTLCAEIADFDLLLAR